MSTHRMPMAGVGPTNSTNSLMKPIAHSKSQKPMQWWVFAPMILAIVLFLLMGTIFERRIEGMWRHLQERRQLALLQNSQCTAHVTTTTSNHVVQSPSQKTVQSCKAETTIPLNKNELIQETRSMT